MTTTLRRSAISVPIAMLLGGMISAAPAQAANGPVTLPCGTTITIPNQTVTLGADIGPCTGDGIDIAANGVTLNLNNHTITGSDTTNSTDNQQVGVRLLNVHNVRVNGPGIVTAFDAGVAVNGGGSNTIQKLDVRSNIAHVLLTGGVDPTHPAATHCDFGDGITTDNSTDNIITGNTATNNGPFSGISLVDASIGNKVLNNNSFNNSVSNQLPPGVTNPPNPDGSPGDSNGPCGPFGANGAGEGRLHQDIGIRVEGPGATNNLVANNHSTGNQLNGISIHGNVCSTFPGGPPLTPPNNNNTVRANTVAGNGFPDGEAGIGILEQGPFPIVCVANNNTIIQNSSSNNAGDGIFVGGRGASGNQILSNTVKANGNDGIDLNGPDTDDNGNPISAGATNTAVHGNIGTGNAVFDGADGNPNCDHNNWSANTFHKVNQPCVR